MKNSSLKKLPRIITSLSTATNHLKTLDSWSSSFDTHNLYEIKKAILELETIYFEEEEAPITHTIKEA